MKRFEDQVHLTTAELLDILRKSNAAPTQPVVREYFDTFYYEEGEDGEEDLIILQFYRETKERFA